MNKYCKDCCWFRETRVCHEDDMPIPICRHPASATGVIDPVYGKEHFFSCISMRDTFCGFKGTLFEPKYVK